MEDDETYGPGMTPEQMRDSPIALERHMSNVRLRHRAAGDLDKLTFGDILREARQDLNDAYERARTGVSFLERRGIPPRY